MARRRTRSTPPPARACRAPGAPSHKPPRPLFRAAVPPAARPGPHPPPSRPPDLRPPETSPARRAHAAPAKYLQRRSPHRDRNGGAAAASPRRQAPAYSTGRGTNRALLRIAIYSGRYRPACRISQIGRREGTRPSSTSINALRPAWRYNPLLCSFIKESFCCCCLPVGITHSETLDSLFRPCPSPPHLNPFRPTRRLRSAKHLIYRAFLLTNRRPVNALVAALQPSANICVLSPLPASPYSLCPMNWIRPA